MLTVIHLSDLHIHKDNKKPDNKNADKLANYLIARFKERGKDSTYVVMTGDLTDDGAARQQKNLATLILEPLSQSFTLLAVPGNHDYATWGVHFDAGAPARYAKSVGPYLSVTSWTSAAAQVYPCITENNKERVVFMGLDSADKRGTTWLAEGFVDGAQRRVLYNLLTDPKYEGWLRVVYLHHHPFDRGFATALREANQLLQVIAGRTGLVLFGHKHKHEAFFRWFNVPLMLASGKVTEAAGGNGLAYRVLEIKGGKLGSVYTEEVEQA